MAATMAVSAYCAGIVKFMKARGKIANEPDDAAVERMERGIAQQLHRWFPDTALTPGKEIVVGAVFIAGGMALGAKEDPSFVKKPKVAAPGAATAPPPTDVPTYSEKAA